MDVDLSKHIANGLNFRKLFIELITVAVGLFLALLYKDLLTETINSVLPEGHNIIQKAIIDASLTVILVLIIYIISVVNRRIEKYEDSKTKTS